LGDVGLRQALTDGFEMWSVGCGDGSGKMEAGRMLKKTSKL